MAAIVFGLAETVLEKLASKAYEDIGLAKSVKENLRKLKDTVLILKSNLNDAEKKQRQNEELRVWIRNLKDVFADAVDVLDEFDCEALSRQVVREYGSIYTKVRRFCSRSNPILFRFSIAHQVKQINERLDEVTAKMAQFQLISSQTSDHRNQERSDRMTHSFVKACDVIGRDEDKEKIIDMLMYQDECNGDKNLSIVPIVGFGGLGKTTLAKSVFNDEKVQGRFDLKIWVCVALNFDVTSLLREILKSANYREQDPSRMSLEQLQTSVRTVLEGKRFLLVLDDVWNEDRSKWLELRQLLMGGVEGSKVIVTTRSTIVSSAMTKTPPYKLQGLSQEDSLSLFFRCSFGEEKQGGQDKQLKEIGKDIVRKCGGVPLALMTLGSLLFQKSEAEWMSVSESKIWEIEKEEDRILSVLRLSYNDLSPCTKQCFAYCSSFQEDEEMGGTDLISIWMALGFLQYPIGKLELEDLGRVQLKELCDRSLIQLIDDDYIFWELRGSPEDIYIIHDLIHNLARSITQEECCVVNSEKEDIHESVRNLRLLYNQNCPTILQRSKKLQSIHISHTSTKNDLSEFFISSCIKQSRNLRVFDLRDSSFGVLPSSIGTLSHLRYLNLSRNNKIKRLPNSICNLQSLQTLNLYRCDELEELPRDLRKLVSLRVFYVTTKQTFFPENGIGCLKSLQIMFVCDCINLRSLPYDIIYCATLRHLIIEDCMELDLASTYDAIVPLSLQTLFINRLPGMTALPQWLKGASGTLKKLGIKACHKLGVMPEWLQNFTSLEMLDIKHCKRLELASNNECRVSLSLATFIIKKLPNTTALPSWLQGASDTLQVLEISRCFKLASIPKWLPNMVSLKKLEIEECHELSTLPEGMQRLTSLTELAIRFCDELEFPSETYQGIPMSLKNVSIGLMEMAYLPQWLQGASHTLESLSLSRCQYLDALPEWLTYFTSLKKLEIYRCPRLSTLPEGMSRLTSLTHLKISRCLFPFQNRYKHESGDDWESIAHVPNVVINNPIFWEFS